MIGTLAPIKNIFMNISKAIRYYIVLFSYAIVILSCHAKLAPHGGARDLQTGAYRQKTGTHGRLTDQVDPQTDAYSQQTNAYNQQITDEHGNPQLLGRCSRTALLQAPYNNWFVKSYNDYTVDSLNADRLRTALAGRQFRIFMGTWCGDSRREVPRIFKILDYCGIDSSSIQLVMVSASDSMYKQSPGHEEKGLDIFRVPDLIVLHQGREMGRIVESPVSSLEKDLVTLTGGAAYTPRYPGADRLMHVFREEKMETIEKELPELAARIKPLVHSPAELSGYARVMKTAGESRKAAIILQVNALIFPD
jgi:hypothetical protein